MDPIDLNGRNILVTGGTHGIGAAAVRKALASGANVGYCARNAADVASAGERYEREFGDERSFGLSADVSDEAAVDAAVGAVVRRFGSLDGVIHAAAILGPIGSVLEVDP